MKKRLLCLTLCVFLLFSALALPAAAAPALTWEFDAFTGIVKVSGEGEMEDFPSTTAKNKEKLEYALIGEGVTSIGRGAFGECGKLKYVSIPKTVTQIGYSAFNFCQALGGITLPEGLGEIPSYCFYCCTSLLNVRLPESVTVIGKDSFYRCENLDAIYIPAATKEIAESAFNKCAVLTIYCPAGSYAQTFAAQHDIAFVTVDAATDLSALFPRYSVELPAANGTGETVFDGSTGESVAAPDNSNMVLYFILGGVGLLVIVALVVFLALKKKGKKE